ncbi:MAG: cyclic nucleotide-binding domain-containing protein [Elusimicrobia bacterium]|nr:cyclic nucleotide-binding domain-containing protein [Elusimicrobiota bacterium]
MGHEDTLFLKQQVDVLGFFEVEQLRRITPNIVHTVYKNGQIVTLKGEFTANFFIVKKGSINIFTPNEPKTPAAKLQKGDFFGVMSLFSSLPSNVTIKSAADGTEIIEIPNAEFQKLLEMQPLLKNSLIQKVEDRMKKYTQIPTPENLPKT